jgi:hypothetical protein
LEHWKHGWTSKRLPQVRFRCLDLLDQFEDGDQVSNDDGEDNTEQDCDDNHAPEEDYIFPSLVHSISLLHNDAIEGFGALATNNLPIERFASVFGLTIRRAAAHLLVKYDSRRIGTNMIIITRCIAQFLASN